MCSISHCVGSSWHMASTQEECVGSWTGWPEGGVQQLSYWALASGRLWCSQPSRRGSGTQQHGAGPPEAGRGVLPKLLLLTLNFSWALTLGCETCPCSGPSLAPPLGESPGGAGGAPEGWCALPQHLIHRRPSTSA